MEAPLARFFEENFAGHLDRWSPPPPDGGFGSAHWAATLPLHAREREEGRAMRWVMLGPGTEGNEVVGTCNITQIARGPFQAGYLGYQVAKRHEGQGLMHEALVAVTGHAFDELRLHRLMANYRPENVRSGRLLARLGFVTEGLAREYLFIDGRWRDHVLAALTNPRYDDAWQLPPA